MIEKLKLEKLNGGYNAHEVKYDYNLIEIGDKINEM